ncbi:DUF3979 family protein [Priestia taiwanensis]|uniref:Uncharacterized protein n=1 Tax=Priestia taiwanensis TaxID=1347902 RepID=A0A917EMN4_9BACI|nr:DUF3979 family protein [Priestia taiwanensis]MBM7361871.1 hypothetical protein [Priestia taiwanensis]GGE57592.1 hypothetical protein GCM10007140_04970 [Priestia taiwanensis]
MLAKLQEFFAIMPVMDRQEFFRFLLTGNEGSIALNRLTICVNDDNELKVMWEQNDRRIVDIKAIAIQDSIFTDDGFEKSVQFILERMPSRMIKVQVEPHLHVEFGPFFESCDECDE